MTIAELQRYRESQGISQLELGRRSGVNSTKISKAEHRHITLRESELTALEDGLRTILRERERRVNAGMVKLGVSQGHVMLAELVGGRQE